MKAPTLEDYKIETRGLIPQRQEAVDNAAFFSIRLFSGRYWDLLALHRGQWHYITTICQKEKPIQPTSAQPNSP